MFTCNAVLYTLYIISFKFKVPYVICVQELDWSIRKFKFIHSVLPCEIEWLFLFKLSTFSNEVLHGCFKPIVFWYPYIKEFLMQTLSFILSITRWNQYLVLLFWKVCSYAYTLLYLTVCNLDFPKLLNHICNDIWFNTLLFHFYK